MFRTREVGPIKLWWGVIITVTVARTHAPSDPSADVLGPCHAAPCAPIKLIIGTDPYQNRVQISHYVVAYMRKDIGIYIEYLNIEEKGVENMLGSERGISQSPTNIFLVFPFCMLDFAFA